QQIVVPSETSEQLYKLLHIIDQLKFQNDGARPQLYFEFLEHLNGECHKQTTSEEDKEVGYK
ncbi:26791_t:CDS:1, partial [Dentiscutata erythropus]